MYQKADRFVRKLTRGENIIKLSKTEQLMGEEQPESGDYMADIKARTVGLTQEGMRKAEQFFGIEDISATENTELNHHIHQALKAHALFQRDKDYVVQDARCSSWMSLPAGSCWAAAIATVCTSPRGQGRGQGGAGKQDPGHHHLPELFPHV